MKDDFILAIATDDGEHFIKKHFGDAKLFQIYSFDQKEINLINLVKNDSKEEKKHADPQKAKSISQILKANSVKVLVGRAFGANIVRMKKKFVCVKCNFNQITDVFPDLLKNFKRIQIEWEKGEDRDFIVL